MFSVKLIVYNNLSNCTALVRIQFLPSKRSNFTLLNGLFHEAFDHVMNNPVFPSFTWTIEHRHLLLAELTNQKWLFLTHNIGNVRCTRKTGIMELVDKLRFQFFNYPKNRKHTHTHTHIHNSHHFINCSI